MSHSNRVRAAAGVVVLLAGLSTVSACGDDGTTGSSKDGKVQVDGDKPTVETSEGTPTIGQDLPDGFPKDDVPLLDEKVLSGTKGSDVWSVVLQTSRSVEDVSAEVKRDFSGAGYTAGRTNEIGDVSVLQFTSDTYDVGVTAARTGGNVTVTYVVKNAG